MKKKVLALFKKNPSSSFKAKDVAKLLSIITEYEYSSLKAMLHKLSSEGVLNRTGKRYKLIPVPNSNRIQGELQITQGGYGFVIMKNSRNGDVFIAARNLGTAFSGDIVEAVLFASQKRKNIEGQIVSVIKRKRSEIIGTLKKSNSFFYVRPDDPAIHRDIYVNRDRLNGAKKDEKVIVGNIVWNSSKQNPEGEVIEILGETGNYETEILSIAKEFNLPSVFNSKAFEESEKIELKITAGDLKQRIDFRDRTVFTIDPEDAKDFDDALSFDLLDNGNYRVGIHIADVSHYVKRNSNLDKEALRRGNSVYLVGTVIPMLPERLSNGICSLVPNEDRLTYSVVAELTPRAKIVKYEIAKTVINSKRRFTYDEVQQIIEKQEGDFTEEILQLNSLAQTLRKKRMREGSIDFFTPEIKFNLDKNGKPLAIYKKEIKQSNMLVEEFMLLANKIVAKHIAAPVRGNIKPFVYRVHDLPDKEKINEFAKFVKSLGYSFDPNAGSRSNQFQMLMLRVRGTEEETLINELAIRSMAKAIYDINNIGHYGLGFKYYAHFTSPIRRYADLIVHRLLNSYLNHNGQAKYSLPELEEISDHISQCERNAIEAERLSIKLKQIEYLKDHLGEEFNAIISGITNFGMFVKITEILAEGLIRMRDIEGDFFIYDEKKYSLIGRASKKQFRLGDKVRVKLVRVDYEKSELDFIITQ
jgi:ribonuclease R